MRAGLSTIQQTLTPEAASVLNHSIAEAGRRNHGQTTPLHVAATLLASPSGYLRQACIRSHPNSSHPLQCRALELCFSVALERLPTAQNMAPGMDPPISNALMAALKRAQAHQRRGCPEQQQQPLLAVKVELEQLIISILDDPSVSRVMREASFSSPAVKSTIEQTLSSQAANPCHTANPTSNVNLTAFGGPRLLPASQNNGIPTAIPAMPNPYMNRRLMEGGGGGGGGGGSGQLSGQRGEEVRKAVDIMMRSKKRNPVLVGEGEPEAVVKELVRRVEKGEVGNEAVLKNVAVVSVEKELAGAFEKNQVVEKIKELGVLIESKMGGNGGGVILDLGDLKWLVEQPNGSGGGAQVLQPVVSEVGRVAVAEMRKLLAGSGEDGGRSRIWLIGTATCETYLRCQVYHPTMENDWDLQAVPVASRSPMPGMFSRPLPERLSPGNNFEPLNSLKRMPMMNPALSRGFTESLDPSRRMSCCPQCSEKYEQELKLALKQLESSSLENKSEPARTTLPLWLQNAKGSNPDVRTTDPSQKRDQELLGKQKTYELQRKWNDTCLRLHPSFHQNVVSEKISSPTVPSMRFCNPILMRQPMPSRLPNTRILGNSTLQLNSNEIAAKPVDRVTSPPRSPVRTELALGRKGNEAVAPEKPVETGEEQVKDLLSCLSSAPQTKLFEKFANALDADAFKKLLKGLMEKAWWQQDAASAVASAVTRCRLGNGKRRGTETKGDVWLLFTGPDRIAKRKMAFVLSEQMCGTNPVMVCLGSRRDSAERDTVFRGKTALDRIVEAVRMNPISVILLEDVDEADVLMRGNIKRAMERGRLTDSHGREISLGNVIFILTGNWSSVSNGGSASEKRFASLVSGNWELKLTMSEKNAKRRSSWMHNGTDRVTRQRIQQASSGLSFDLNLALGDGEDDRTDGSHSSSDLTVDHDDDQYQCGHEARQFSITSVPHELVNLADDAIMFKPADLAFIRSEIKKTIATKFSMVLDDRVSIQVDEEAVERIIGGLWHGRASLEEWVEKALAPSFDQLSARLPSTTMVGKAAHLQLELEPDSSLDGRSREELLPGRVAVMVE